MLRYFRSAARGRKRWLTGGLLAGCLAAPLPAAAQSAHAAALPVSYNNPPARVVWIPAAKCRDTNFVPGVITRGQRGWFCESNAGRKVLDLASWRLPDDGPYYARFHFSLPATGRYVLYLRGEAPGVVGISPITWQVNDGPERLQPRNGKLCTTGVLAHGPPGAAGWLRSVVRLGTFQGRKGPDTITIRVRQFAHGLHGTLTWFGHGRGGTYYALEADALLISRAGPAPVGAPAPEEVPAFCKGQMARVLRAIDRGQPLTPRSAAPPRSQLRAMRAGMLQVVLNGATGGFQTVALGNRRLLSGVAPPVVRIGFVRRGDGPLQPGQVQPAVRFGGFFLPARGQWARDGRGWLFHTGNGLVRVTVHYQPDAAHSEIRCWAVVRNLARRRVFMVSLGPLDGINLPGGISRTTYLLGSYGSPANALGLHQALVSPSKFTHDWACVFDGSVTLYTMWQDRQLLDTVASFGRLPSGGHIRFTKFPKIRPGKSWTTPVLVIGADRTGGWYHAADLFRQWFWSWAHRPAYPKWFRLAGGMIEPNSCCVARLAIYPPGKRGIESRMYSIGYTSRLWGESPAVVKMAFADPIKYDLLLLRRYRRLTGLGLVWEVRTWAARTVESWYPLSYRLSIRQLRQLRTVLAAFHHAGGRVSVYTNAIAMSRVVPAWELYGKWLALVKADGYPDSFVNGLGGSGHPMALLSPGRRWAKHFLAATNEAVVLGRIDSVYLDLLGSLSLVPNFRRGTASYGDWRAREGRFVHYLVEHWRRSNPTITTSMESSNIAVQQYGTVPAVLYYNIWHQTLAAQAVFRYTFPWFHNFVGYEHTAFFAGQPGAAQAVDQLRNAAAAWLLGDPVCLAASVVQRLTPAQRAWLKRIILTKRKLDPLLYGARFRYRLGGLTVAHEGRRGNFVYAGVAQMRRQEADLDARPYATSFVTKDGTVLICFVNPTASRQALTVRLAALTAVHINHCQLVTLDRDGPLSFALRNGRFSASLPPNAVGLLRLMRQ